MRLTEFQESKNFKLFAVIGIVALAAILYLLWPKKESKNELIDYLQKQNDSLRIENRMAAERDIQHQRTEDSLFNVIRSIDSKIIRTKEYYERIIHHYDTATARELEQFFSERYPR